MRYFIFFTVVLLVSCKPNQQKPLTVQEIIDRSMQVSGSAIVANAVISFDFRDKSYKATRNSGKFKLERTALNDGVAVRDVLSNEGFKRYQNDMPVAVADSMVSRYSNAVNSVHYFSVLPFGLNDKAVKKKLLPEMTIKGKEYYKIEIRFEEEGGGEDFDDVFIYWIDKQGFKVDYLAYLFHVNGGGIRFRELKEQCIRNGVRFVDYNNYKALNSRVTLMDLDKAYEADQLKKVSEIVLKNIKVEPL